jgi:hypothetical protein
MTDLFRIRDRYTGITYYGTIWIAPDGSAQLANSVDNPAEFLDASGCQVWGADLAPDTRRRIEGRVSRLLELTSARHSAIYSKPHRCSPWLRRAAV